VFLELHRVTGYGYEEQQVAPPVVRQVAPPSTISKGVRVKRESTLRI